MNSIVAVVNAKYVRIFLKNLRASVPDLKYVEDKSLAWVQVNTDDMVLVKSVTDLIPGKHLAWYGKI